MSSLFSVHRHRASQSRANVAHVAQAVIRVMKRELDADTIERWRSLLDCELGQTLFCDAKTAKRAIKPTKRTRAPAPTPTLVWAPSKPRLSALLLSAFLRGDDRLAYDGQPMVLKATASLGTHRALSKLVTKRAIDWLMANRSDAIRASLEATAEQLSDGVRIHKVLSRCAADVLAYLHAVVMAKLKEGDSDAVVLELHRTDQRLTGKDTKGCGIVYCTKGRALFERVVSQTLSTVAEV